MNRNPGGRRPTLGIVAGPNGAGKTSFYEQSLWSVFPRWINADAIARTLTETAESKRNLEAAKQAEQQREQLLIEGATFAFETVFSRTDHWIGFLRKAKSIGYRAELYFVCTSHSDMTAVRVKTRMAPRRPRGGSR